MLRADSNKQRRELGRELLTIRVEERRKYEVQSMVSDGRAFEVWMYSGCAKAGPDEESKSFREAERFKDSSGGRPSSYEVIGGRSSAGFWTFLVGTLCTIRRSGKLFFSVINFGRGLRRVLAAYDAVPRCICSVSGNASKLLLVDNDVGEAISRPSASRRLPRIVPIRAIWVSPRCGSHWRWSEVLDTFTSVLRDDSLMDNIDVSESMESDRAWGVTPASNSVWWIGNCHSSYACFLTQGLLHLPTLIEIEN